MSKIFVGGAVCREFESEKLKKCECELNILTHLIPLYSIATERLLAGNWYTVEMFLLHFMSQLYLLFIWGCGI